MRILKMALWGTLACVTAYVQANSLSGPVSLATGINTRGLAVADLDNDGSQEVVVANFGSGVGIGVQPTTVTASVQIFKRSKNGLALSQTLATGNSPRGIAIADLNNDHRPDLLVTFYGENTLGVYLQNPDGTFAAPTKYPTGSQPVGVDCLVIDGKPVVAVSNYGSNTLSLFTATSSGQLIAHPASPLSLAGGLNPTDVIFMVLGGRPHLVTANYGSNFLSVIEINSTTAGAPVAVAISTTAGSMPCKLSRGDLNQDGKDDLAVALFGFNAVALFTQGGALFNSPVTVPLKGVRPNGVAVGDIVGRGRPSVLAADRDSDQVDILNCDVSGHWSVTASLSVKGDTPADPSKMEGPVSLAVADVSGDSRPDLLVTYNKNPGSLKVFTQALPSAPVVGSDSHPDPTRWYTNTSPSFQWQAPQDLNGIASYRYSLDQIAATIPGPDAESTGDTKAAFQAHATGTWYFHVLAVDACGNAGDTAHFKVGITAEMSRENVYNYPNPSRDGRTTIRFPLDEPAPVNIQIYDETGRLVWSRSLGSADTIAGVNTLVWEGVNDRGRAVANGGYILKVTWKDKVITKKIAIIR